jgi:hypothetical protein
MTPQKKAPGGPVLGGGAGMPCPHSSGPSCFYWTTATLLERFARTGRSESMRVLVCPSRIAQARARGQAAPSHRIPICSARTALARSAQLLLVDSQRHLYILLAIINSCWVLSHKRRWNERDIGTSPSSAAGMQTQFAHLVRSPPGGGAARLRSCAETGRPADHPKKASPSSYRKDKTSHSKESFNRPHTPRGPRLLDCLLRLFRMARRTCDATSRDQLRPDRLRREPPARRRSECRCEAERRTARMALRAGIKPWQ